jgi:hypothetical protein
MTGCVSNAVKRLQTSGILLRCCDTKVDLFTAMHLRIPEDSVVLFLCGHVDHVSRLKSHVERKSLRVTQILSSNLTDNTAIAPNVFPFAATLRSGFGEPAGHEKSLKKEIKQPAIPLSMWQYLCVLLGRRHGQWPHGEQERNGKVLCLASAL